MERALVNDVELLSTPCEEATLDDVALAQDLLDTMASLEDCVCLAANQIGVTKRVAVFKDDKEAVHVIFNPVLKTGLYPTRVTESCLTLEEPTTLRRFGKAKVTYDELVDGQLVARKRDFQGWEAQILQHMIDHCNGKLV